MKSPLYVRELSLEEAQVLERALHSPESFTLRRAQILRLSAKGRTTDEIAEAVGCAPQTVRTTIHAFHERGLDALKARSRRPKTIHTAFDEAGHQRLMEMAHTSPREFGKARSTWSLEGTGRSRLRGRSEPGAGRDRDHPPGNPSSGVELEASEALDYESRCTI